VSTAKTILSAEPGDSGNAQCGWINQIKVSGTSGWDEHSTEFGIITQIIKTNPANTIRQQYRDWLNVIGGCYGAVPTNQD
jgi:hypothetical protein